MKVVCVKTKNIRPKYKDLQDWMKDPHNVYIGRKGIVFIDKKRFPPENSIWANPFRVDKDGSREVAIEKYREYIEKKICDGDITDEDIENLRGKNLGCWCSPLKCHGDILVEIITAHDNPG